MKAKTETLQIRLTATEKLGFEQAAAIAGIPISAWVRERLRESAIRELERIGQRAPFIPNISMGGD